MDNNAKFVRLREEYPEFIYESYNIEEDKEKIILKYKFKITNLTEFNPKIEILKKDMNIKELKSNKVKNMIFHIGLIELISYWKCTCSKKVIVKCGNLNEEQKSWFKKLYFYGLGELLFTNNIKIDIDNFMEIICEGESLNIEEEKENLNGYIVPVGGGKDSIVTLETLNIDRKRDYVLIVNPKPVTLECAKIAGFENDNIIEVNRYIDNELLRLNKEGYINGHTPFSSLLAFLSYFISYVINKKYIALSNESSANESNVSGEKINHQYSKSYEFEKDFEYYAKKYLKSDVKYFSFLRPLNELQIAKIFSKQKKYHQIFKSCNVGSKEKNWHWCTKCPKCLFVFAILSPYLYKDELIQIFKKDLFEDEELLSIFVDLIGEGETKPFECVGTFEEVKFGISLLIEKLEREKEELPYLLKYYKKNYELVDTSIDITKRYNEENNLSKEQECLLKEVVKND